jgi:NTP pyrophosphatase (non-canonical NTP hydrolase)
VINTSPYEDFVQETAFFPKDQALLYLGTALAGEVGEVCNEIKKCCRDEKNVLTYARREKILDECGDVLWYLTALVSQLDSDLKTVMFHNMMKIVARREAKK